MVSYFQAPISYIYPPTFYAVSDKFTIFVPLKTTKKSLLSRLEIIGPEKARI